MTEPITAGRVTPELQTSQIFKVRGQKSRWFYPDPYGRLTPENPRTLRDVNISERGTADVRRGYTLFNQTQISGAPSVVGLNEATYPASGLQRLVVTPTAIFTDNGTTRKTITGSVTWTGGVDDRCRFVYLDRKVFVNNGVDQVISWTGDFDTPANMTALTGMQWTKVRDIVAHRGLLVALRPTEAGVDEITRIRWSDIDRRFYTSDTGVWPVSNRTEIYEGGPPIIGGVDNWGRLWVFKQDGVYAGRVVLNVGRFEYEYISEMHGFEPISHLSLVARPEFIFGAAREGAFVVRPDGSYELVTIDNQNDWRDLNQGRLQYSVAWVRERDHQIRLLCSSSTNTSGHDMVMVWDWETGDVWFDRPTDVMGYAARAIVSNVELDWFGSTNGYLFQGNGSSVLKDNDVGFDWEVFMHPNDLGLPNRKKLVVNMRTYARQKAGQQTINLFVELDQGKQPQVTASLTAGTTQKYNSGLKYNTGLRYEGGTNQTITTFINRIVETIAPRWVGTDSVELVGYDVEWMPLE